MLLATRDLCLLSEGKRDRRVSQARAAAPDSGDALEENR